MITILMMIIVSHSRMSLPVNGLLLSGLILDLLVSVFGFILVRDMIQKWRGF